MPKAPCNIDQEFRKYDPTSMDAPLTLTIKGEEKQINTRLSESIDSLANKMLHKDNFFEMIIDPTIYKMVNELKMIKDS